MSAPRPKTAEEVRAELLNHFRALVAYWARVPNHTTREALDGLAFSILTTLDGSSLGLPSFDLVARPHPDDEQFHKGQGENWIPDGLVINEQIHMHDEWHKK